MTSLPQHTVVGPPGEPPGPMHRWSGIATVAGTVIGGLGLVVAILAWLLPKQNDHGDKPAAGTNAPATATSKAAPATGTGVTASAAGAQFLDAGGLTLEAGNGRTTELPRAIKSDASYTSHPIAIRCPSNQAANQVSDVTYSLLGRYAQFEATVHPYYPPNTDQRSATYVTVLTAVREIDGTLTTKEVGSEKRAGPASPLALSAPVDHAEKLTIRVQCGDPDGIVVLTDARVTPE